MVTLFAGTTGNTLVENVPATSTGIYTTRGLWGNTVGDIFFSDVNNNRLRVVSSFSGLTNTILGNGLTVSAFITTGNGLGVSILSLTGVSGTVGPFPNRQRCQLSDPAEHPRWSLLPCHPIPLSPHSLTVRCSLWLAMESQVVL